MALYENHSLIWKSSKDNTATSHRSEMQILICLRQAMDSSGTGVPPIVEHVEGILGDSVHVDVKFMLRAHMI